MSEFFLQALPRRTFESHLMETLFERGAALGTRPLGCPMEPLYGRMVVQSVGMTVVVCADSFIAQERFQVFHRMGYDPPDMVLLDGNQMPHEFRDIHDWAQRGRIRILLTTAERMTTLHVLQILAHTTISTLVIEDAQFLLPAFSGSWLYRHLPEGLAQLKEQPPLLLLTLPLPLLQCQEIIRKLQFPREVPVISEELAEKNVRIRVQRVLTEEQKRHRLLKLLIHGGSATEQAAQSSRASLSSASTQEMPNPQRVIIHTRYADTAKELLAYLSLHELGPLFLLHHQLPSRERANISRLFLTQSRLTVVGSGYTPYRLRPPTGEGVRVIYWDPPYHLDEMMAGLFQIPATEIGQVDGWAFHTKDDVLWQIQRLKGHTNTTREGMEHLLKALHHWRKWVLSETCRHDSLASRLHSDPERIEKNRFLHACGQCDRCLAPSSDGIVRQLLNHLLY